MHAKVFKPMVWLALFVMLVGMACNAATGTQVPATDVPNVVATVAPETEEPVKTEAPVETEAPVKTEEPATTSGSGAVSSLQDVKKAVIQIESQGTFIDPQVGLVLNGAGRGSGFIIDPSGIAVTNNHVVTGSALLKVWVGGDQNRTYNAKVLGVSECSDLAVIDIEGDGFPFVQWYSGPVDVGLDVYVAGFPLGDPEYSLSKGIISKAKASGETVWSSVDHVIEYDANTNPGNSGGPVVSPNGEVLGVHFASYASARQAFGISSDIAKGIVDQLKTGKNVDSIGVNGQAIMSEDQTLSGVWVSSVQSGSAADKAGLKAGDIILEMENLILASDGSLSQYCDILRSHDAGDTLGLRVLRWAQNQILEGQLNGRQLEISFQGEDNTNTGNTGNTGTTGNANASASGDYFISTEFDDNENWYTFAQPSSDNYEASTDNSRLLIEVKDKESSVYALYDFDVPVPDVRIDAKVETVGGPNRNNISLVCRATNDGWYEFSMNSGGYWYIWKFTDKYEMLASGASRAIKLQRAENTITATCIGDTLTFYVNGVEMGSTTDKRFKGGGQTGISVSTFDIAGAEVEFDWFAVTVP